jgi:hypothetical protein
LFLQLWNSPIGLKTTHFWGPGLLLLDFQECIQQ